MLLTDLNEFLREVGVVDTFKQTTVENWAAHLTVELTNFVFQSLQNKIFLVLQECGKSTA